MLQPRVRISGPSWGGAPTCMSGPSPPLNPQAEHRVSPSVVCVRKEAATCTESGALLFGAGRLLPPGSAGKSALYSGHAPGQWHAGDRRNQTRRRKSILHAMLPSRLSPHAAAGFTGAEFKESQQRQLFGLLSTGITVSPPHASSFPLPWLASSWA